MFGYWSGEGGGGGLVVSGSRSHKHHAGTETNVLQ